MRLVRMAAGWIFALTVIAWSPAARGDTPDEPARAPASLARALVRAAARVSPTVVLLHVERYAPSRRRERAVQRSRKTRQRVEEERDMEEGIRRETDWPQTFRYESRPRGPVSGVMVRSDGLVLTAKFNVEGPVRSVHVELADGRIFPAEILGWESDLDLAAVRVRAPEGTRFEALPVRPRKEPRAGTSVAVVGASWGRVRYTVATGIVSALDRRRGHAVQLAAQLNWGNTGGAVIDLEGRLVGIAGHVRPTPFGRTGLNSGLGFATAAHRIHEALPRLERGDRMPPSAPPLMGIHLRPDARGGRLFITQLAPGSGAEQGGLEVGDQLISIANTPIVERSDVKLALERHRVGQEVIVVVNRGGVTRRLTVRLGDGS